MADDDEIYTVKFGSREVSFKGPFQDTMHGGVDCLIASRAGGWQPFHAMAVAGSPTDTSSIIHRAISSTPTILPEPYTGRPKEEIALDEHRNRMRTDRYNLDLAVKAEDMQREWDIVYGQNANFARYVDYSSPIKRTHPAFETPFLNIGVTHEQLDQLFYTALNLEGVD